MKDKKIIWGLLLCLLVLLQVPVNAAPASSGFLNATWGNSMRQVTAEMEENGYRKVDQGPDYVSFMGLFAGELVEVRTEYINDSMYFGAMIFLDSRSFDTRVIRDKFDKTEKMLEKKYGSPNKSQKNRWISEANWKIVKKGLQIDQLSIVVRGECPWYFKAEDRNRKGSIVVYYTNESLKARLLEKYKALL
ncbi:MAG: hypothetical protein H6Q74_1751 [Firmicutes bacterium]|nr:hypothetical protein [Bacillota bacterium]